MTPPDAPAHEPDRFDVLVVGSGFGSSVAALRLTEKGYRIGIVEAGRRFADHDKLATPGLRLGPALGLFGVQRIHPLRDVLVMAGAGVGGGSLNSADILYGPPAAFFDDQASRMLGVTNFPGVTAADRVMRSVAHEMGVADTVVAAPVVLRDARRHGRRPVLRRSRTTTHRMHTVRRLHDRMLRRREEHPRRELPVPRRTGRRANHPDGDGRWPPPARRWL